MIDSIDNLVWMTEDDYKTVDREATENVNRRIKIANRKKANQELINILSVLINQNDDLRFGQILDTFFIKNHDILFYEEPVDTLAYVKEQLKKNK